MSLTEQQFQNLVDAGFTAEEIRRFIAQQTYRHNYNLRPEVKAKRAAYNRARNQRMSELKSLLK